MRSLLTIFSKKKISEEALANVFVNSLVETVEQGFPEVAALINEDPDFKTCPGIGEQDMDQFLLIVLVGNIKLLSENFEPELEEPIKERVYEKCGKLFGCTPEEFRLAYREYCEFLSRINHPSKNVLYSMSRAVFYKYNLNEYQLPYFKTLNTPNPIFLKRMNEVLNNFIWDWEAFFERYRVVI